MDSKWSYQSYIQFILILRQPYQMQGQRRLFSLKMRTLSPACRHESQKTIHQLLQPSNQHPSTAPQVFQSWQRQPRRLRAMKAQAGHHRLTPRTSPRFKKNISEAMNVSAIYGNGGTNGNRRTSGRGQT